MKYNIEEFLSKSGIGLDDVYVVNPLYRMRNEFNHVIVYGDQGLDVLRLHRAYAVALAMYYGNIYQPPTNCFKHNLPFVRQI